MFRRRAATRGHIYQVSRKERRVKTCRRTLFFRNFGSIHRRDTSVGSSRSTSHQVSRSFFPLQPVSRIRFFVPSDLFSYFFSAATLRYIRPYHSRKYPRLLSRPLIARSVIRVRALPAGVCVCVPLIDVHQRDFFITFFPLTPTPTVSWGLCAATFSRTSSCCCGVGQ